MREDRDSSALIEDRGHQGVRAGEGKRVANGRVVRESSDLLGGISRSGKCF